jgi:hypothetical protein
MNEKKEEQISGQKEPSKKSSEKSKVRRYTGENKKVTLKLNESVTGPRRSRGKKQRRQFKLAPNRG